MNRRGFLKALVGLPVLAAVATLPKSEENPIEVTDEGEVVITARHGLRIDDGTDVAPFCIVSPKERMEIVYQKGNAKLTPLEGRSGGQTLNS